MIRIIFFSALLFLSLAHYGQGTLNRKALKLVEKGDEAVKARDFDVAKESFSAAIGQDSLYGDAYLKLMGVLSALKKLEDVHHLRLTYVRKVPRSAINPTVWQHLAVYALAKGEYGTAKDYIQKAAKVDSLLSQSIDFSLEQIQNQDTLAIAEMPPSVNRYAFQYLPTITVDGRSLIYTSRAGNSSDENIVISHFDGQNWSEATSLAPNINSRFNEGACTISADGRMLIFTSCEGRQSFGNCDLYMTKRTGSEWSTPENLGRKVNSTSWDSQPALSADGKTLYFISNRPGGIGGRDIWVTKWDADGWAYPANLGKKVNTTKDETTPFLHANNETLFFSSNGHVGMGGFDLYRVQIGAEESKVENLGFPINTFQDEISMIISSDGLRAYFAKEQSIGGVIATSKLVTYEVPLQKHLVAGVTYITGTVRDVNTKEPLEAKLEIIDLLSREKVYATSSDAKTGHYYLVLPMNKAFGAFIEKDGYLFEDISFSTENKTSDTLDIFLQPFVAGAKLVLKNIYFEFDSDKLDEKSFEELARVAAMLKNHPTVKVEISGHTDASGSNAYNLSLSDRRAKRVYDYLITVGVSHSSLSYVGRGASMPLNSNRTEAEKEQNRRIEFGILAMD